MEKIPENKDLELKNYSNFLNLEGFDPNPIVKKCSEDPEYKKITVLALKDRIRNEENPELLDSEYKKILRKAGDLSIKLKGINRLSEEMILDFLHENNITESIYIQGLNLFELRNFIEKGLRFFDNKLSSTTLALANDDFEYLKGFLTSIRGQIAEIKDRLQSDEFEMLPRNTEKIQALKERLELVENL